MKISGMNGEIMVPGQEGGRSGMACHAGFKKIFDHQMSGVNAISHCQTNSSTGAGTVILDQGERLLSLLDRYANDLENPGKMLKQIEPLVMSIENEVVRIQKTAADATSLDEDLRLLVEELAVTADVATFKFHRGDFI